MIDDQNIKSNKIQVTLCLGSSCFSRGNKNALQLLTDYIKNESLEDVVELRGSLCEGKCNKGPNIIIDGKFYENIEAVTVIDLLKFCMKQKGLVK